MKLNLQIEGMTCSGCASNITNMISTFNGVKNVTVNLNSKSAELNVNRKQFNHDEFIDKLNDTKFTVKIIEENSKKNISSFFNKITNLF